MQNQLTFNSLRNINNPESLYVPITTNGSSANKMMLGLNQYLYDNKENFDPNLPTQ